MGVFIKFQAENSKEQLMYFNKDSKKNEDLFNTIGLNKDSVTFFKELSELKLKLSNVGFLINFLESIILELINSEEYEFKTSGRPISIRDKQYYLNTKSHKFDRKITSLNSLLKIALYCKEEKKQLVVELVED